MRIGERIGLWSLGGAVALSLLVTPAFGWSSGPTPAKKNSWTGYLWVPGYHGDSTIRGTPFHVSMGVADTLDGLKDLNSSFIGHYERNESPWTYIVDVNYWQLKTDAQTAAGRLESKPSSWLVEVAGARTVSRRELKTPGRIATAQLLGGLRWTKLELDVENTTTAVKMGGHQDWFDPFLGARYFYDLDNRWTAGARFDLGGFGVGSDFTWNLLVDFAYRFSRNRSVIVGWHILDQDFKNGSFRWNVQQSGPLLAISSRF